MRIARRDLRPIDAPAMRPGVSGGRRRAFGLTLALTILATPAAAGPPDGTRFREMEASLLHRQIDLRGILRWDEKVRAWAPLPQKSGVRLMVVNLWAVSCGPCRREMPRLRRITEGWRGKEEVRFLLVSETSDQVETERFWRRFWAERKEPAPELLQSSDERIRHALGVEIQPVTLLVDDKMIVRQAFVGAIDNRYHELVTAMERLLKVL